jgi:hypothetical protein
MENQPNRMTEIYSKFESKSVMKQDVYQNTRKVFSMLQDVIKEFVLEVRAKFENENITRLVIESNHKNEFEYELRFASDALVFIMHSNVFQFPRENPIMRSSYIKEDETRAYCGVIYVYNFLADTLKYQRENDIGYLIARIFVNKDMHFVVEGKRQMAFLNNSFVQEPIERKHLRQILETAVIYSIDFDLLLQPYDNQQILSYSQFQEFTLLRSVPTGKRLGFRFQTDPDEIL